MRATAVQRAQFLNATSAISTRWEHDDTDQFDTVVESWKLLNMLVGFSQNRHITQEHQRATAILAFGRRHVGRHRNPAMIADALREIAGHVSDGDGSAAADIVRDLYAFVALPYLLELGITIR